MTKSELKTGMIVVTRKGTEAIVYTNTDVGNLYKIIGFNSFFSDKFFDETLKASGFEDDVVKVYSRTSIYDHTRKGLLMWEREEDVIMTIAEIEEKLGITNLKIKGETK